MRKWGVVVTAAYATNVLLLLGPVYLWLAGVKPLANSLAEFIVEGSFWILPLVFIGCQALLLFLSVDTSHKRLKPRAHILVSCALAAFLTMVLCAAVFASVAVVISGDKTFDAAENWNVGGFVGGVWLFWGLVFFLYARRKADPLQRLVTWLLRGSVLELLVAVPCHVWVRRRGDCSAPAVTGLGIATGIAMMLLAFGPSILFLVKQRLDAHRLRRTAAASGG